MAIAFEDLQPKEFEVQLREHKLKCKPLRLSHTLIVSKIGNILENSATVSKTQIQQAERDMDDVISDLIPELKGVQLGISDTIDLIAQMMESVEPSETKELKENNVKVDSDPKV